MSTKQLTPIPIFTSASMATSLTSQTVELLWVDNVAIHLAWTGTPVGTIAVNVSLNPTVLGWTAVPFTGVTQPTGSAGSAYFELNQTGSAYIQVVYTASSSTGTLNGYLAAKSV